MARAHCSVLITGATVLAFDGDWRTIPNCDIGATDARIDVLGTAAGDGVESPCTIDGRDLIVIPGFCNSHTHSPESLGRGLAEGVALEAWLHAVWSRLDCLDDRGIDLAIRLCAAEMLHGGVTSVVDHFRQTPLSERAIAAAASAWSRTGMRATLAIMVRDAGIPPWVGSGMPDTDAQLELCRNAALRWGGNDQRLQIAIGPSAPTRCTDRLLRGAGELASAAGLNMHMHCDETLAESRKAKALYGRSAIEHLENLGLLGPNLSLAHCVWIDDGDMDRLARHGVGAVHNPVSNLRLGSGVAPLADLLERGVRVAIGTDGAASNDSQNVLEAIKLALLLPRTAIADTARWPSCGEGLTMATLAPAAMFGMESSNLAVGAPADFVAFDRRSPLLSPANNLVAQIAFAGSALRARHVVIGGRLVLRDEAIVAFDEAALLAEAMAYSRRADRGVPA